MSDQSISVWVKSVSDAYSPDQWSAFFSGASTLFVVLGVPLALWNLHLIAKQQDHSALLRFMDDLETGAADRHRIYREFPRQNDYADVDPALLSTARRELNSLNRIGLLIERRMLPARDVLSITHTMIIRSWYKLECFAAYEERRIGGRYGRRVCKLAETAKRFHDARPKQRVNPIKIEEGNGASIVIYVTNRKAGLDGALQWIGWNVRYFFKWY